MLLRQVYEQVRENVINELHRNGYYQTYHLKIWMIKILSNDITLSNAEDGVVVYLEKFLKY